MKIKSIQAVLLIAALSGCESIPNEHRSAIDDKLIGTWAGEYTEKDGATKSWTQRRKADGTYSIDFVFMERDGTINRFSEAGQWWVKDGLFHEIAAAGMKQPDSYQYHFQEDGRCIVFLLVDSHESIEEIGQYRFVECLSEKAPLASSVYLNMN
ncbi:MAG: hypothetical protein MRK00_09980 [Nitrosomonas sp.]|nr:hypothetical protein [Nitrosomonas sp.]